jgi:hypothetical protein
VLIAVSHQFEAENLAVVIPFDSDYPEALRSQGFYCRYADAKTGQPTREPEVWHVAHFELATDRKEYFRAIRRKQSPGWRRWKNLPSWINTDECVSQNC